MIELALYRHIEMSQQGHRWDICNPENRRVCIAHSLEDADLIVNALNAHARKQKALSAGFGKKILRAKQ